MKKESELSKISNSYRQVGPYIGLGTQLAAAVVIMFFLGRWLDAVLSTTPLFIIIFSILGSAAGIYNFIRSVLNLNDKKTIEK